MKAATDLDSLEMGRGRDMADTFENVQGVPAVAEPGRNLLQPESGFVSPRGVCLRWWVPWQCKGTGAAGKVWTNDPVFQFLWRVSHESVRTGTTITISL